MIYLSDTKNTFTTRMEAVCISHVACMCCIPLVLGIEPSLRF